MADKTVTVGNGKTYADLKTAIATEFTNNPNLTSNNGTGGPGKITFECYNLAGGTGESVTAITDLDTQGFTTDANNYVILQAAASEITAANAGKWSTERYRILPSTNLNVCLTLGQYTQVFDFQIWADINANNASASYQYYLKGDNTLWRCIARADVGASANGQNYVGFACSGSSGTHNLFNCLAYDFWKSDETNKGQGFSFSGSGAVTNVYNCTSYHNGYCYSTGGGTVNWRNCGASDWIGAAFNGGNQTTCVSNDPTFVDAAANPRDLHLAAADTIWRGQGTDYSATFTTDIDGQTRPTGAGTWDVGFDQYVAVSQITPGSLYVTLTL